MTVKYFISQMEQEKFNYKTQKPRVTSYINVYSGDAKIKALNELED
jgi:hypothetical protein